MMLIATNFLVIRQLFVRLELMLAVILIGVFKILRRGLGCFGLGGAGKVYFIAGHYDVKLQADTIVRWDVVLRD